MPRRDLTCRRDETPANAAPPSGEAGPRPRRAPTAPRAKRYLLAAALALMTTACGEVSVTSVPTETDAIEILDVLGQSGLEASKKEAGEGEAKRWVIVVDEGVFGSGEAALAVQVLRDHGLPRPEEPAGEDSGLIPSERAEKLREQRRLRIDIERQLRALPGVTLALVTIVMPQDPTLELNPYPATASVVINHRDAKPAFTEQVIQNLVARGVPNLKPQDVSVTMSQQTLRPIPQRELYVRRRNNILLAAGISLVTILSLLLVVLLLRTRRQRAELAGLRESGETPAADAGGDERLAPTTTEQGRLDAAATGER